MKKRPLYKTGSDLIAFGKLLRGLDVTDVAAAKLEIERSIPKLHAIADLLRDALVQFEQED